MRHRAWRLRQVWLRAALGLLSAICLCFASGPRHVSAQTPAADSPIVVTSAPAVTDSFPDELTFTVSLSDSAAITDVVLDYTLLPENSSVRARAEFDKGTSVKATYHMRSNGNPLYLAPGKRIQYTWDITDANGVQFTTPAATAVFDDNRFQWQTVSSGNLTLYFYRGNRDDAMHLLSVGRTALDKAGRLENASVDFPVRIYVYASSNDFLPAAQKESKATDPGILGQALTPDAVILWVQSSLQSADTEDTVRHELTHLVTGQAVTGGFSDLLPLWLNEGISVYSQNDPGDYGTALRQAIATDTVVPIQILESSRGVDVGLFYGESYGLVKFLVEGQDQGPAKLAQLLAAIKSGTSMDQALQSVYGFDRTGLYNAWRDSVHLSGPGTTGSGSSSQAGAALTPIAGGRTAATDNGPSPSRGSGGPVAADRGANVLLATVGGALALLLLAAAVALGLALSRRSGT